METLLYDCAQAVAHIERNVAIKATGKKAFARFTIKFADISLNSRYSIAYARGVAMEQFA